MHVLPIIRISENIPYDSYNLVDDMTTAVSRKVPYTTLTESCQGGISQSLGEFLHVQMLDVDGLKSAATAADRLWKWHTYHLQLHPYGSATYVRVCILVLPKSSPQTSDLMS